MHLTSTGLSAGPYRSISAKLNLALLLAVTVTFLIAGTMLNAWLTQRLEERGLNELKRTNQQVVDMVDAYSGALEQSAEMMGMMFLATLPRNITVDAGQQVKTGDAELPALKAGNMTFNNDFTLVDQFTAATGGVATLFVRHGDNFFRATTSLKNPEGRRVIGTQLDNKHPGYAKLMAGQAYIGPALLFGRNYMTSYVPIMNSEGKVIAVSFIGVDFTEGLKALKSRVLALKIGERGYSFVIDAAKQPGLAIIHPAAEGKNLLDLKDANGVEVIRRLLEIKSGELRYWWQNAELGDTAARERIAVVAPFDKWGWIVATGTDLAELNREVATVRMHLITTGLAILAVLAATIFWTTRRWISRPLAAAVAATQSVAGGDLTREITVRSNDEVGILLGSLDAMARHLRQMVKEIDGGIRHLAGNAEQLASASEIVSRASEEQSASASAMAATVEEMTTSIGNVAAHAESCQQMAAHSGEVSESGSQVIREAVGGMTEIATTVVQSSVAVTHLGEESQQISQIVNVIREIADQTNLLALNAAIEAARAGEAGRGFAVVADEVRKLAERTTQSTQEITTMVDRIQHGATDAVQRMHQGERQVTAGVNLANEAGQRIDEIKAGADDVRKAVTGIADALQEQNAANQEIARNVEQIAQQAERNFAQAKTTADTAHGMKTLSEQLRAGIARFRT